MLKNILMERNSELSWKVEELSFRGWKNALGRSPIGAFFGVKGNQLPRVATIEIGGQIRFGNGETTVVKNDRPFTPGAKVIVYQQGT